MGSRLNHKGVVYPYLSYKVVGVCFEVHNEIGRFAKEKQYGDLIEKKFIERNITYRREMEVSETGNKIDFVVGNKLVLELKNIRAITKTEYLQVQRYLQASGYTLGILVNFRTKYLSPKRILKANR